MNDGSFAYEDSRGEWVTVRGPSGADIQNLSNEVKNHPTDIGALERLAFALGSIGDRQGAADAYRQITTLREDDVFALTGLGVNLLQQNLVEEAVTAFEQALQKRDALVEESEAARETIVLAHVGLGDARRAQGRPAEARAEWSRALETARPGHAIGRLARERLESAL